MGTGARRHTGMARCISAVGCAVALGGLAGCSGSHGAAPAGTSSSTTATTVAPGTTTTTTGATSATAPASGSEALTVPAGGESTTTIDAAIAHPTSGIEFYSPSRNIHCEIDYGAPYPDQQAFCFSGTPPQSATLSATGTYTTCTGMTCLANPAVGEVELPYGQAISLGPFRCLSSTGGMTCTSNGKGFEISTSGVVPAE